MTMTKKEIEKMQESHISRKLHGKFKISQEWKEKQNRKIQKSCLMIANLIYNWQPCNMGEILENTQKLSKLLQSDRRKYQIYYINRFERLLKNLCPFDEDFLHETELVLDSLHISLDLPCQD